MESGGNNKLPSRGGNSGGALGTGRSSSNRNNNRGAAPGASSSKSGVSSSGSSGRCSAVSSTVATGSIIVTTSGAGGVVAAPPSASEWEMFQFGTYPVDILEMLSGHQAHQFKGLGLERQLPHQQQVQLHQHPQQLQQQQQGETSGALLSGIGLGSLQGSRSNSFADSSSIFAKMSAPLPPIQQQTPSTSSQSSRKSSKMGVSSASGGGSGGSMAGYPQFLRSLHPTEAALAQEQLHPGMGRFEHFAGGSVGGGAGVIGGVVTSAPPAPPPPLHPGISVPQASPGPSSSSPPSSSTSTSNNPSSSGAVASLGQQPVGAQSDARSLHQQFSCMLAANQYFLSGVPTNASLEQFLVQQGTHNHLSLGLGQGGTDSNSALAPPPALHPSHSHAAPQQQQQLPPHALPHPHSHPHSHHPLHPTPQPSTLGGFDFQGIPVLSSNQLATLMQQETGLPLPLPLHLSLSKDDGKADSGAGTGGGGGRRKKAMAGYLPQRKPETSNGSSNCHASGESSTSNSSGGHGHSTSSSIVGEGVVGLSSLEDHSSLLNSPPSSSSSSVSSTSSSSTSSTAASVLVTNGSQIPKIETLGSVAPTATQPEPEPLYHCGECGKTFTHLSSLRRHLRSHGLAPGGGITGNSATNTNPSHSHPHRPEPNLPHSTQDVISQSNPPHQQQQQQVSLNLQQSNSAPTSSSSCPSPEKIHCCPDCGKRFKKRGHLLQHGVIHSGERPFSCTICQRSFNRRESLTRHEKIHEDKPFRCPACGRCFRESTSLLNHAASGTCGKPSRGSRSRGSSSGTNSSLAMGGNESFSLKSGKTGAVDGAGMIAGRSEVGEYQGGQLASPGEIYGKAEEEGGEERRVVECMMGVNEEEEEKTGLSCGGLFQQERGGDANSGIKGEAKYGNDFPRNRYQVPYRGDEYRVDYKQHRSQTNSCYPGESSCGNIMPGPTLRKAPLAPTLHPHPQNQTQQQHQQQPHLPLSSLLDDSEDDVTSSVSNAMSAIAAAAAASCIPNEHNGVGARGEERRDIIGGLLGGLGFGPLGGSPGAPSSTSGIHKTYRGSGNEECLSNTMLSLTQQNQQQHSHQQPPNVKPKKPRKPRAKKERIAGAGTGGEGVKRKRHSQSGGAARGEGKERPYLCSVCGRGFSRRETLRRHDRIHTGEKPHHCSVCGKNFREAFHLSKHHTVHSGEKNYKCDICGKDFGYAQSLKRHGKLHQKGDFGGDAATTGVSNCSAPVTGGGSNQDCNQGNSDSYYSYSQDKPQGSSTQAPPRLYTCAVCWKSFRHHFHLTAHHQAVHGSGEKLFSCEVCGKAFAYANSLTRHRLSQHGLTRTGHANPPAGGGAVGSRAGGSRPVPESEIASNTLLQLVPASGTHGGHQTHMGVPHTQHPPQQCIPNLSPLFYVNETVASPTNSLSHSQLLQNHCSLSHNHQHHATTKGDPIYPSAPASLVSPTTSLFLPNSQQQQNPQQIAAEVKTSNANQQCHSSLGIAKKHKAKKRKLGTGSQVLSFNTDGNKLRREGRFTTAVRGLQTDNSRQLKRRRTHQQALKKKLAQLKIKGGAKFWQGGGRLPLGYLPSSAVPQKRFSCVFCPFATFPRRSALLVHCAARHPPKTVSGHVRGECCVCGKRSRKLYVALCHRGFHLAQGTFSCPRCPFRFWNETLLRRHTVACRGVGRASSYGDLKMLSLRDAAKNEDGPNNQTTVVTDSRL